MMHQPHFTESVRQRMNKALEVIKTDVATIRTGRAHPAIVEHVMITAYDGTAQMRLAEMATISTSDARTILLTPFDPTQVAAIEKGILVANVGLTPVVDGQVLRLTIPSLTEERREEYIKLAKAKIEGGRVMVRQIRHDVMAEVKKKSEAEELNEDEKKHLEKEIQTITDMIMGEIDGLWMRKEEELRQV